SNRRKTINVPTKPLNFIVIMAPIETMDEKVKLHFTSIDLPKIVHQHRLKTTPVHNRYYLQNFYRFIFLHFYLTPFNMIIKRNEQFPFPSMIFPLNYFHRLPVTPASL